MDKHAIIKLKQQGLSNRKAATILGINRKTVARYWNEYQKQSKLLLTNTHNIEEIQERLCEAKRCS